MPHEVRRLGSTVEEHVRYRQAAWRVSLVSVTWTVISSALAVTIGLRNHETVLIAFGATGIVDAIGSVALTYHFLHALKNEEFSERWEGIAHRVVLIGLLVTGGAAVIGGLYELVANESGGTSNAGVALASVSIIVLASLSLRKIYVARRVGSDALRSDGHLSAMGASFAVVAVAGTLLQRSLNVSWADAGATVLLGAVSATVALRTHRAVRLTST
jgi:divalent metal cation (Fe/Co/Zn/Cd) transporter